MKNVETHGNASINMAMRLSIYQCIKIKYYHSLTIEHFNYDN